MGRCTVRRLLGGLFVTVALLVWIGCQQTQEGDEPDTVVKEKETIVQPAPPAPAATEPSADVKMKVETGQDSTGASAEVKVQSDSQ